MPNFRRLTFVIVCCVICSGCGGAKIKESAAQVESLQAKVAELEAEKAELEADATRLQSELMDAEKELEGIDEIRKGYEDARTKFQESMKKLSPLVGDAASPFPPFEGLKDSNWVGQLAPGGAVTSGVRDMQDQLKQLLGDDLGIPAPKPKSKE